jgi:hypothetical protein
MADIKNIFYICTYLWRYKIYLLGYNISIVQVVVFVFLASILFKIVKDIF